MLIGAISFSDTVQVGALVERLTAHTVEGSALVARKLYADRRFVCMSVQGPGGNARSALAQTTGGVLALSGNVPWDTPRLENWLQEPELRIEDAYRAVPGHWAGLRYRPDEQVLELFNDRLGIGWTYVARLPWGYVFGPDFGALAQHTAGSGNLDYQHLLATLGLGYALDESTCFDHIRLLPAAALLRCEPGQESLSTVKPQYGSAAAGDISARKQALGEVLTRAAETWIEPVLDELDISLSAGLDCRYGLGLMLESGHVPRGFTFGHRHSGEVAGAKAIARTAGMTTDVFEVQATDWQGWQQCVARTGAVGGFHWPDWLGWLRFLQTRTPQVLIGFLGDAFSGKHLAPAEGETVQAHADAWTRENADPGWLSSSLLTARARKDTTEVIGAQLLGLARNADYEQPHQVQLHLDWYGRQRRFTGAQPNLMQAYVGVVPFLYHSDVMDYWQQSPATDLVDQHLYREYAAQRFPNLFSQRIQKPSLLQRLRGSTRNALANLGPRWKQRFAAPVLDPVQMLVEQKPNIQALLDAAEPELSTILDYGQLRPALAEFPESKLISPMQLRRIVNVAILVRAGSAAAKSGHGESGRVHPLGRSARS